MLGDGAAVDEGAVAALEILDLEVAIVLNNEAVAAGEGVWGQGVVTRLAERLSKRIGASLLDSGLGLVPG